MSGKTESTSKSSQNLQLEGSKPKKLLDQVREALRTKHYAYRTEQTYIDWIKRYIIFHKKRHPKDMDSDEIREFIGCDTLAYLSLENLSKSVLDENGSYCYACYTGRYPTDLVNIEDLMVSRPNH